MKQRRKSSSAEKIRDILVKKRLTLSIAESVTCGHLQACFASIKDTGQFFHVVFTVYNLGQKTKHLRVEPIHAELENCVSEAVAQTMAIEVNRLFLSDVGISITGYASPMPELGVYDLYAFIAISHTDKILSSKKIISRRTTVRAVQKDYCEQVLAILLPILEKW